MPKWTLANSMDLYLYPRLFEPLFREFFGKAALFCPRQNVEFEQTFLLVLLNRHSECMCHCVDAGKAQNTLGGFKMTIENARVLQEQLANEAIVQQQKNGSKTLADDCIRSIAVVGKAWGIPADETAHRQARAQQEQTQRVGDAGPRENTVDSDMLSLHLTRPWRSCISCGICLKQHLTSVMMQTAIDCLIQHTRWRQFTCHPNGLAQSLL